MKILDHNVETGEVIEREATEAELEQAEIDAAAAAERAEEIEAKEAARAALLERLGITEEEAKLLLA
jgi:hypothetical protein